MSDANVCMYKHVRLGGLGACSPRKILEIGWSEIALRLFWDRSGAVATTWL